jgi:putative ABC transport system ATP-binding protein
MTTKLILDTVTKVYGTGEGAVVALDAATLRVAAGELVAIVGPSGSGKTTFLAIAGALLSPTRGQVILDGRSLTGLTPTALAGVRLDQIGFILQAANLLPGLNVRDQLLLIAELAGRRDRAAVARAERLLDTLGLARRARHYPEGLSGGERQRVAIARALMNDPALILADEPTASLDSRRGREVVELLAREIKAGNKAGLIVTHDEQMLDLCDRVVRIEDGRLHEALPTSSAMGQPLAAH